MKFPNYIPNSDIDWFLENFSQFDGLDIFINRLLGHASSSEIFDSIFIASKGIDFNWADFFFHCFMGFSIKKDEMKTKIEMDNRSNEIINHSKSLIDLIKNENTDDPTWVMAHSLSYDGYLEFQDVDLSIFDNDDRGKVEVFNLMAEKNITISDLISCLVKYVDYNKTRSYPVVSQPNRKNSDVIYFCRIMVPYFRSNLGRPLFSVVASLVNALYEIDYDIQNVRDSMRGYNDNQ